MRSLMRGPVKRSPSSVPPMKRSAQMSVVVTASSFKTDVIYRSAIAQSLIAKKGNTSALMGIVLSSASAVISLRTAPMGATNVIVPVLTTPPSVRRAARILMLNHSSQRGARRLPPVQIVQSPSVLMMWVALMASGVKVSDANCVSVQPSTSPFVELMARATTAHAKRAVHVSM